jgi:UDP-glucose 4-epimerase
MVENKTILITGASGYIASNVLQRLITQNCEMVLLSRSKFQTKAVSGSAHEPAFVVGDLRIRKIWEQAFQKKIDIVFHFAAQTSVPEAEADPLADMESNVVPMLHLLETCRSRRISPIVILAGTATEIGLPNTARVDESMPDAPVTIYDLHKLVVENYLKFYIRQGIVRGASLRLCNVYGPGPEPSSSSRGVLNQLIRKALRGEELTLYGKGDNIRDYVFIDDVVEAFLKAADQISRTNGHHFYIGSGRGVSLAEAFRLVADRCGRKTGRPVAVRSVPHPASSSIIEGRNYIADPRRFREATGWASQVTLSDGIDRTIESCLNQYVS